MNTRWLFLALAIVLTGCPLPETVWISAPPPVADARSVVWFLEWEGQRVAAAQPLLGTEPAAQFPAPEWNEGPPSAYTVVAAFYLERLVELGLAEGRLSSATAPRPCQLNTPHRVLATDVVAGTTGPWNPTALNGDQQTFLTTGATDCLRPSRCPTLGLNLISLEGGDGITHLLTLDDDRVLAAQDGGPFTLFTQPGDVPERQPQLDERPTLSMARRPDGIVFFGGRGARVSYGPLEGPFVDETLPQSTGKVVAMIAAEDDSGRVYALETDEDPARAALHRFQDGTWTRLWNEAVNKTKPGQSDLVWVGPDVVLGVYGGTDVVLVQGDRGERISALYQSPFGGALANSLTRFINARGEPEYYLGGSDSWLYRAESEDFREWGLVDSAEFIAGILGVGVADDAVVMGGEAGVVQLYYPNEDVICSGMALAGSDVEEITAITGAIVVSGGSVMANNRPAVTFIRSTR